MYIKRIKACAIWIALPSVFAACQKEQNSAATDFSANSKEVFENYLQELKKIYHLPGVEMAVVSKDSIFGTAAGIKNINGESISSSSIIAGGAFSEPVLASAVLTMAHQGILNLEDPVVKHLSYFRMGSEGYKNIKIKDLLTHTSGIDSYGISYGESSFEDNAPEITTRSISNQQLKWNYSERRVSRSAYNYDILADLVSKVSQTSFEDCVRKTLFLPLNMKSSYFYKVRDVVQLFSVDNSLIYSFKPINIYPYNRENGGSGGFHTTASDLSLWMQYVLKDKSLGLLEIPVQTSETSAVGYGWEVFYKDGVVFYEKETRINGFSNKIILIPSKKIGVALMANVNNDLRFLNRLDDLISFLDKNELPKLKTPIHIPMSRILAEKHSLKPVISFYQQAKANHTDAYDFKIASLEQLGVNLVHQVRNLPLAIDYYKFCVKEHSSSSGLYLNLAEAYVLNNDVEKAKEIINTALKLPDDTGFRKSFLRYLHEKIEIIEEKK